MISIIDRLRNFAQTARSSSDATTSRRPRAILKPKIARWFSRAACTSQTQASSSLLSLQQGRSCRTYDNLGRARCNAIVWWRPNENSVSCIRRPTTLEFYTGALCPQRSNRKDSRSAPVSLATGATGAPVGVGAGAGSAAGPGTGSSLSGPGRSSPSIICISSSNDVDSTWVFTDCRAEWPRHIACSLEAPAACSFASINDWWPSAARTQQQAASQHRRNRCKRHCCTG